MAKKSTKVKDELAQLKLIGLLRISTGLVLFWAFLDKLFGLGFSTCRGEESVTVMCDSAWLSGGSPTFGFLNFGTSGPLSEFYAGLAGVAVVDWLFMLGLGLIGLSLLLGIGIRVAAVTGSLLFVMMWSASLPPENHPFLTYHLIYVLILMLVLVSNKRQKLGFGEQWAKQPLVKKYPWLK